jgi:hypothetical protein
VTQITVDPNHPQFRDAFERLVVRSRHAGTEVALYGRRDTEMTEGELRAALRFIAGSYVTFPGGVK